MHERTSFELLAHFDRPGRNDRQPAQSSTPAQSLHLRPIKTRGIRWALKWASAMATLIVAASILTQFGYILAAEHKLNIAARAALSEAMLPRATTDSVRAAAERRLRDANQVQLLQLTILQNGKPVERQIRPSEGDMLSITLS